MTGPSLPLPSQIATGAWTGVNVTIPHTTVWVAAYTGSIVDLYGAH